MRISWFGLQADNPDQTLTLSDTWAAAGEPLLVLTAWAVLATVLARRSMRWEPRS